MGRSERRKGANGERELAALFVAAGLDASRNARNGLSEEDIAHGIDGLHVECKRYGDRARFPEWWEQTVAGAGERTPALFTRADRGGWLAMVPATYLLGLVAALRDLTEELSAVSLGNTHPEGRQKGHTPDE